MMRGDTLAVDLGGSSIKLASGDLSDPGRVLARQLLPGRVDSLEGLIARLQPVIEAGEFSQLALTIPGVIEADRQFVRSSANLPWLVGVGLAQRMQLLVPGSVSLIHDGVAAALSEATLGAGRTWEHVLMLTWGTGLTLTQVRQGAPVLGSHGASGEIGHINFGTSSRRCTCGQRGCLETSLGGDSLARRWESASAGRDPLAPRARVTAADLSEALRAADPDAMQIGGEVADELATILLALWALYDPEAVVIGGGIARAFDVLIAPGIRRAHQRATFHRPVPVVAAELGIWAGAQGALLGAAQSSLV